MFEHVWTHILISFFAVQNNDYSPGPYTITFPPGRMNSLLRIAINDDNVLEENETFNLTVRVINSLILSRVSTGNVNQVTVAILDNDRMLNSLLPCAINSIYVIFSSYYCNL